MNWLLTVFFFIFIFGQYFLSGEILVQFFGYKKSPSFKLVMGFFFTFFLTFITAFPFQYCKWSWSSYYIVQCIVFIIFDFCLIYYQRDKIKYLLKKLRNHKKEILINFFKENWIGLLFVCIFTIFSMSNQLPYYQMNYDDFYYIGKITNLIGADHLMNEDYFNGAVLVEKGIDDIARVVNTYEITYGFFSNLFHIDVTFFCRVTMVIHNYIFVVLIFKMFAGLLLDRKYTQYVLVPFFLFLLPQGYLESSFLKEILRGIQSYDLWQFQTAIFYGSSVIRVMSLPVLFVFSYPMIRQLEPKKIIWIAILSVSLLSFSTVFIQFFIIFSITIFIIHCITKIVYGVKVKDVKSTFLFSILLLFILIFLFSSKLFDHLSIVNTEDFRTAYWYLTDFDTRWIKNDLIYLIAPFFLVVGFFVAKETQKTLYAFGILLYILFSSSFFYELLNVSSFNMYFVSFRLFAATQYLCLLLMIMCIVQLYGKVFRRTFFLSSAGVLYMMGVISFFFVHINDFVKYDYLASGVCKYGWDFSRVLDVSTKMTPDIFYEIGEYFNQVPYGNYRVFAPSAFEYDGKDTLELGLMMSSNKIQIHERGGFQGITDDEIQTLTDFSLGGYIDIYYVQKLIEKYDIDYILMHDKAHKNELISLLGAEQVLQLENVSGPYYLVKI